jgi:hypothetical protein
MQTNLEQVTNLIRSLPLEDLDKLDEVINEERQAKRSKKERLRKELEDYAKSKKWIAENGEKYLNQWVCLEGDRLIAHGADGREVYRKARAAGVKAPFINFIEEEPEAFWGGWL